MKKDINTWENTEENPVMINRERTDIDDICADLTHLMRTVFYGCRRLQYIATNYLPDKKEIEIVINSAEKYYVNIEGLDGINIILKITKKIKALGL